MMETLTMDRAGVRFDDVEWIDRLMTAIDEFRKLNPSATANQIVTFLAIAQNKGITQRDLSEKVGLDDGTVSRICAMLSERGLGNQKGYGVIKIVPRDDDYRLKGQELTDKGRKIITTMRQSMKGR